MFSARFIDGIFSVGVLEFSSSDGNVNYAQRTQAPKAEQSQKTV